jgi:hypothetical protein
MGLMSAFEKLLDPYERKARLLPGLLLVLPAVLTVLSFFGSGNTLLKVVLTVMTSCGVPFLVASITRDAGKKMEDKLVIKWGGMPSTLFLRHIDKHFAAHTKKTYHEFLAKGLGVKMPSIEEEALDLQKADDTYRAAGFWLRGQTKDVKKFPHVFRENIAYGFRRNLMGLKYQGFCIALACILLLLAGPALQISDGDPTLKAIESMGVFKSVVAIICLVFGLVWLTCFSEGSLLRTAEAYADRLIRACEDIKLPRARKPAVKVSV